MNKEVRRRRVKQVELEDLLTGADVGRRLGVSRERAHQLAKQDDFPAPLGKVGSAIVWRAVDVAAWAKKKGRAFA